MGKTTISLKLNFLMSIILKMSSILFPLITFPYVSRILLPEGTGKVAFATSLISYFTLFSQLGIPTYGIRACAKVRDDKIELSRTAQELVIINLVTSAIMYIILFFALCFVPRLREERPLYLLVSLTILFNAIGMEWLYRGLEQYTYITVRSVAFKLIAIVAMFTLIHNQDDYIIYGGLSIFAASASSVMNFAHAHKYITMHPVGGYHFQRHLKAAVIFFAMSCATTIYTHIDSTMLGFIRGNVEVGYYDAAIKVRTALLGVVTSLGAVLLPRSSYYVQHGRMDEFKKVSTKALHFVFLLATPLTVYFILFAVPCINLLSGPAYLGTAMPMRIIMPTVLIVGITNILGIQMLVPLGREKVVLCSEIAGAAVDLVLNALLIPKFGISGAAIGTLVAEIMVFVVQFAALREDAAPMLRSVQYGKIFFALIVACFLAICVPLFQLNNFLLLVLSAMLFFGAYGGALLLTREPLITEMSGRIFGTIKGFVAHNKKEET